jgi:hypothetical protein
MRSFIIVLLAKHNWNDQVKKDETAGHVTRVRETRKANRIMVGKPEGKGPLGRPKRM